MKQAITLIKQFNAGLITCSEVAHQFEMINMGSDTTTLTFRVTQGVGHGFANGRLIK